MTADPGSADSGSAGSPRRNTLAILVQSKFSRSTWEQSVSIGNSDDYDYELDYENEHEHEHENIGIDVVTNKYAK